MLNNIHAPIGSEERQPFGHLFQTMLAQISSIIPNAHLRYDSDPVFTLTRAMQVRQKHSPDGNTISPPNIDWSYEMSGNPIFSGVRNRVLQLRAQHAANDGGLLNFVGTTDIPLVQTKDSSLSGEHNVISAQIHQWLTESGRELSPTTDLTVVAREMGLSNNDSEKATEDLNMTEMTPNVVAEQVYTQLIQAEVPLKLTSDLPEIAREIVIPDIVHTYSKMGESFEQILDRLVEMGFKHDDQLKMNVTRAINDQLTANDPPSPAEIDHIKVVADLFSQTFSNVRDYALGINQPDVSTPGVFGIAGEQEQTAVTETLGDTRRMSLRNVIQRTSQKCRQILQKTGKLIRTTGGAGIEFGKGLGTSIGVAAEQIPVALGLDHLAQKIRGIITQVLKKQSQREMGFRTQIAKLLTGETSLPKPDFTIHTQTEEEDWARDFLQRLSAYISWLKENIPPIQPLQMRVFLGLATLTSTNGNNGSTNNGEEQKKSLAGEHSTPFRGVNEENVEANDAAHSGQFWLTPRTIFDQTCEEKNGGFSPHLLHALSPVHDAQLHKLVQLNEKRRIEENARITAQTHARIDAENTWTPEREEKEREKWGKIITLEFPQLTGEEQTFLLDLLISNLQVPGYKPDRGNGIRQMAITAVLEIASRNIIKDSGILNIDTLLVSNVSDDAKNRLGQMRGRRISRLFEDFPSLLQKRGLG